MGERLFVVSGEGLIKMKRQAGRPQDLADIDRLEMKQVDMSSEAITRRLRQASQLRDLSLSLMKGKKAHDLRAENERSAAASDV